MNTLFSRHPLVVAVSFALLLCFSLPSVECMAQGRIAKFRAIRKIRKEQKEMVKQFESGCTNVKLRPQDELWVIDSRNVLHPTGIANVRVSQIVDGEKRESSLDELARCHVSDRSRTTVMYVHGWRTSAQGAIRQAVTYYNELSGCGSDLPPMRWIAFEWESEKTNVRLAVDYREKSNRVICIGQVFTQVLAQFQDRRLTIVTHSLGGTLILSSLTNPSPIPESNGCYRVVLTGTALDCDFSVRLRNNPRIYQSQIRETVVINNQKDPVLKIGNQFVCGRKYGSEKGSLAELVSQQHLPLGSIRWHEISSEMGSSHGTMFYARNSAFKAEAARLIHDTYVDGISSAAQSSTATQAGTLSVNELARESVVAQASTVQAGTEGNCSEPSSVMVRRLERVSK